MMILIYGPGVESKGMFAATRDTPSLLIHLAIDKLVL